jgi:hypothetical protein
VRRDGRSQRGEIRRVGEHTFEAIDVSSFASGDAGPTAWLTLNGSAGGLMTGGVTGGVYGVVGGIGDGAFNRRARPPTRVPADRVGASWRIMTRSQNL